MRVVRFGCRDDAERAGVSEVIANLLVLSITVVLFSTIFFWLFSMPPPKGHIYIDLSGSVSSDGDFAPGSNVTITLSHRGGRALLESETLISIGMESGGTIFTLVDGGITDGLWNAGDTWSYTTVNLASGKLGAVIKKDSVLDVSVVDLPSSEVIWRTDLFPESNVFGPQIIGGVDPSPAPINRTFYLWAKVVEIEGQGIKEVRVTSTDLGLTNASMLYDFAKDRWQILAPSGLPAGKYSFTVYAVDSLGLESSRKIYYIVGATVAEGPDLQVTSNYITFSDEVPTRGTLITINAVVFNIGGTAVGANVSFYRDKMDAPHLIGSYTILSIPSGGGESAMVKWVAAPAGPHPIWVKADAINLVDVDPSNNIDSRQISVFPRILLVDDDQEVDSSAFSTASYMKAAMYATDFPYDLYVNGAGTGPDYDSGNTMLRDYDVVVWMTGRQASTSLTSTVGDTNPDCGKANGEDDVGHLTDFLCGGGRLWLISEGVYNDAQSNARLNSFLGTFFHSAQVSLDSGVSSVAQSTGTPIWGGFIRNFTMQPVWAPDGTDTITSTSGPPYRVLRSRADPNTLYGVNWSETKVLNEFRSVLFTTSFAFFKDPGDQAQVTYRVLLWLGGMDKRLGRDVSISSISVAPSDPRFMQDVTINVTVRNNGDQTETNFQVLFTDTFQGVERPIGVPIQIGSLGPYGAGTNVSIIWQPDRVGTHILRAKVDWNNMIPETNENNNEISSLLFSGEVYIGYNILVVDDDGNEGTVIGQTNYNTTLALLADFAEWNTGLTRPMYEYDLYTVGPNQNGPSLDTMKRYNAVVWNTGTSSWTTNVVLSKDDRSNITSYLTQSSSGARFYLIGQNVWDEVNSTVNPTEKANYITFLCDYFGADFNTGTSPGVQGDAYGTLNDPIAHGMHLSTSSTLGTGAAKYAPKRMAACGANANGLVHAAPGDDYWTSSTNGYFAFSKSNTLYNFRTVFAAFDPSYLANTPVPLQDRRGEFTYMVMHWLGVPDPRANAKITPPDIFVSGIGTTLQDEHMEVSRSYILKARVRNTGMATLNGLALRFYDDNLLVATESASIPASSIDANMDVTDGEVIVEAIWNPLFAGMENVSVVLDPDAILSERTREDNLAFQNARVYFFYDDLESGGGKWRHEGVVARINGENPIDFLPASVQARTDIPGEWESAPYGSASSIPTYGMEASTLYSNSDPNSFWFPEVPPSPVDITIVVDTSGSMDWKANGTRKWDALVASLDRFLDAFKDPRDRFALISFASYGYSDSNPFTPIGTPPYDDEVRLDVSFTTDRNAIRSAVANLAPTGGTPLYASGYYSTTWTMANYDPKHTPVVVLMTDGQECCNRQGISKNQALARISSYSTVLPVFTVGLIDTNDQDLYDMAAASKQIISRGRTYYPNGHWDQGQYFYADVPQKLDPIYAAIAQAIIGGIQQGLPPGQQTVSAGGPGVLNAPPDPSPEATYGPVTSQKSYTGSGARTTHTFTGTPTGATGTPTLTVCVFGDYRSSYEYARVRVEGTYLGRVARYNGNDYLSEICETFYPTPAQIDAWAADGQIDIEVRNTYSVGTWWSPNYHKVTLQYDYAAPCGSITVSVTPSSATLGIGGTQGFTAAVMCGSTDVTSGSTITWSVTGGIGSVSPTGGATTTFTATNAGSGTVVASATYGSLNGQGSASVTVTSGGGGGGGPPAEGKPLEPKRWAVTPLIDLRGVTGARLTFWHRYNMLVGRNGALVQVGLQPGDCYTGDPTGCADNPGTTPAHPGVPVNRENDGWHWEYIRPVQPYSGNLDLNRTLYSGAGDTEYLFDEDGYEMVYAWNGVSGGGTFGWEFAEFDLSKYAGHQVRLNFSYFQFGGGTGYGWWVDDVTVTVTRGDGVAVSPESRDRWVLTSTTDVKGIPTYAWWNQPDGSACAVCLKGGLDNSLVSVPIDLTSARLVYLNFDVRYNVNSQAGLPPDSLRVEVSQDNGVTWAPINLGVRIDPGVSGQAATNYWTNSLLLTRLETNLSGWAGNVVLLRFRLVTTTEAGYAHYESATAPEGVWIDDIRLYGVSSKKGGAGGESTLALEDPSHPSPGAVLREAGGDVGRTETGAGVNPGVVAAGGSDMKGAPPHPMLVLGVPGMVLAAAVPPGGAFPSYRIRGFRMKDLYLFFRR